MKKSRTVKLEQIPLSRLVPHPLHANRMPPALQLKLRRNIERTGLYEPLIVRRIRGSFELIHGHHRLKALASLGYKKAACLVWKLTAAEALLLLATLNRLSGRDAAKKRVALLEALARKRISGVPELAEVLPEERAALQAVRNSRRHQAPATPPKPADLPVAFTIFLRAAQKQRLLAALAATNRDKAGALMSWLREHEPASRDTGHGPGFAREPLPRWNPAQRRDAAEREDFRALIEYIIVQKFQPTY